MGRLAASLLAGTGVIATNALLPADAKARLTGRSGRIEAVITPEGDSVMNDLPIGSYKYDWLALCGTGTFDLSTAPVTYNAGVVGVSNYSDAWASANRIPVGEFKPEWERGNYSYPEMYPNPEPPAKPNKVPLEAG